MGNTCIGPKLGNNGFLSSVTAAVWKTRQPEPLPLTHKGDSNSHKNQENSSVDSSSKVDGNGSSDPTSNSFGGTQSTPPPHLKISADTESSEKNANVNKPVEGVKQNNKPSHVKRLSSVGLKMESVLGRKTENLKEICTLGRKLGQGQFGTTYLCVDMVLLNVASVTTIATVFF